jgi:hypothetical protein
VSRAPYQGRRIISYDDWSSSDMRSMESTSQIHRVAT